MFCYVCSIYWCEFFCGKLPYLFEVRETSVMGFVFSFTE